MSRKNGEKIFDTRYSRNAEIASERNLAMTGYHPGVEGRGGG
jgi:hypothetical protein